MKYIVKTWKWNGERYTHVAFDNYLLDKAAYCDEEHEETFETMEDAIDYATDYMHTHNITARDGSNFEWEDDRFLTWLEARDKHIIYAKETKSIDPVYHLTISEKTI